MQVLTPEKIEKIENIIGYKFNNKKLIITAFTHSSFSRESSNERMEFLGDGILNFIVADILYNRKSNIDEGVMSVKRSKIVSSLPLSKEVERLNLLQFLLIKNQNDISTKIKSNIYEAIIAAIYLDSSLENAKKFVENTLMQNVKKGEISDFKTLLQEKAQLKRLKVMYKSETLSLSPPYFNALVFIGGEKKGEGKGKTKKEAEQNAAKTALNYLQ